MLLYIILFAVFAFLVSLPWLMRFSWLDSATYLDRYNAIRIFLSSVVLVGLVLQPHHPFADAFAVLPMGAILIANLISVGKRMRRTSVISQDV